MEDLITDLKIMVDAWRKLPAGVGNIQVAANQVEGVVRNYESRLTQRAADGDYWKCVCGELHMEGGTYCDVCGTDRPRR